MSADVTISDTWSIFTSNYVMVCKRPYDLPTELNPNGIIQFIIAENSILGILSIIGRQGDITQFLGSHPTSATIEFGLSENAKNNFDVLEPGELFRLRIEAHEQLFLDIYARLLTKGTTYPSTGGEAAVSTCFTFFVEDELKMWLIEALKTVSIATRKSDTWTPTSTETVSIATRKTDTWTPTISENVSVATRKSDTWSISTEFSVTII